LEAGSGELGAFSDRGSESEGASGFPLPTSPHVSQLSLLNYCFQKIASIPG